MESSAKLRDVSLVKMHGTHNEFLIVDERPARFTATEYPELARRLCNGREFGLSADGLLVIGEPPATGALAEMRIFNADGSEAEMCGNGVRCAARFLSERGAGATFTIATLAGPIVANVVDTGSNYSVGVDIGSVGFPDGALDREIEAGGKTWSYVAASLGNPHIVIVVRDVATIDVPTYGRLLATHPRFPDGTNVHFVELLGNDAIAVRHYERGVGITQACGTGAVACAAVARERHGYGTPVNVRVPGGVLVIDWEPGAHAILTGPAEVVFERTARL